MPSPGFFGYPPRSWRVMAYLHYSLGIDIINLLCSHGLITSRERALFEHLFLGSQQQERTAFDILRPIVQDAPFILHILRTRRRLTGDPDLKPEIMDFFT